MPRAVSALFALLLFAATTQLARLAVAQQLPLMKAAPAAPVAESGPPTPMNPRGEPLLYETGASEVRPGGVNWWSVAVSPDGKTVATGQGDSSSKGEVKLWDRAAGKVRASIAEPKGTRCVAIAPNGKLIATGNYDAGLRLYDSDTTKLLALGDEKSGGHKVAVNGLCFFKDGKHVATAGLDNTVRVWDVSGAKAGRDTVATLAPVAVFEGHTQGVLAVAVSADGRTLLSGSFDRTARVWDVPDPLPKSGDMPVVVKKERLSMQGHNNPIEAVAVSPNGELFVTGSWDAQLLVRDRDGKKTEFQARFQTGVMCAAFSADGKFLAAGSGNMNATNTPGEVRVWDVAAKKELAYRSEYPAPVLGIAFTPDAKTVATVGPDRALHLWEYADPKAVKTHNPDGLVFAPQPLLAAAVSPNGDLLAVANEAKTVYVMNRRTSTLLAALSSHDDVVAGLAFSPDGKTLATASYDKSVKLWDAATWKERKTLAGHTGWVLAVAFTPDGKTVATGSYDKSVRLWDAATGEPKATWREHTAGVRSLSFDTDGKRLATGGSDRIIRVWDVADGKVLQQLKGHKAAVRSVAFSPDGATIATGSEDKTVKLWTAADGKEVRTFPTLPDMVTAVRFSAKGQTLVASSFQGSVAVLDPLTGRLRQTLSGHNDTVTAVLLADGGQNLLTVSQDRTVKQWPAMKGSAVAAAGALASPRLVGAMAFLPNGQTAVLGGYDGSLALWDVNSGKTTPVANTPPKLGPIAQVTAAAGFVAVVPQEGDLHVLPLGKTGKAWSVPGKFAAFTPDGQQVAVASGKDAILYDAASGKEVRRFVGGHDGPVIQVAFSPDGKRLATAGDDTKVRLWETATATKRQETPAFGNYSAITHVAFSPDGTRLAVAAYGPDQPPPDDMTGNFRPIKQVSVFTLPAQDGSFGNPQIFAPQPVNEPISGLAWSSPQQLVSPSTDGTIRLTEAVAGGNPRETKRFRGHDAAVLAFALAPDGQTYITAGEDMAVRRWDVVPPSGTAATVRISGPFAGSKVWVGQPDPTGGYLYASSSSDKKLQVFTRIPAPSALELKGNFRGAYSAAFAPDGKTFLTGHEGGELIAWDAKTGKELTRLPGLKQAVRGIAFTTDGKSFVTVGGHGGKNDEPGDAVIWDAAARTQRHKLTGHKTPLWCVVLSPDDTLVVAGCFDGSIVMWDAATGKHVRTLEKHTAGARSVAFSPDGKTMVSGGFDNVLRVWDTATWEETHTYALPNSRPSTVLVSPDGKEIVCGSRPNVGRPGDMTDCIIYAYRLDDPAAKPRELKGHTGAVLGLAFLKDGTLVSTGGRDREYGELKAWDFARGEVIGEFRGHRHWLEMVAASPDGETLVSAGWGGNLPGELRVWNAGAFKPAAAVATIPTPYISCGETTPDGKTLVLGGWDGTVVSFDMTDPKKPVKGKTAKGHAAGIRSLTFDAAGKRFVTAAEDGTVVVWDAATLEKLNEWQASKLPVYRARFTPDGTKVVTAAGQWRTQTYPGELRVWHPRTGEEAGRFPDQSRAVWDFVFLDGGKTLVSAQALSGSSPGEATLKVWDFDAKTEKRAVRSLSGVRCLAASPDGKFVALANNSGQMRVLDTATWQEAFTPPEHTKVVFHLAFGRDNRTLYSASEDGTLGVTRLPGGEARPATTTPPAATPLPKE